MTPEQTTATKHQHHHSTFRHPNTPTSHGAHAPIFLKKIPQVATESISKELHEIFNYALVWGRSTKYDPQRCGFSHEVRG